MKPGFVLICILTIAPGAHAQGSTFVGRVLTDSGSPIAAAEVLVSNQRTSTNEKGEFRVTSLKADQYQVLVRMPGYAPKTDTIKP